MSGRHDFREMKKRITFPEMRLPQVVSRCSRCGLCQRGFDHRVFWGRKWQTVIPECRPRR